jgi:hypothetical protein
MHPLIYVPRRRLLTPAECLAGQRMPTPRGANGIGIGIGCGMAFGPWRIWAPAALLPGASAGIWLPFTSDYLTRNTQPSVSDWTTGTGWSGSGATGPYAHSAGSAGDLTQALGIVGNRVRVTYTITGRTAGTLTFYAGTTAGTARSTNDTFTEDLTVAGNTTLKFEADASFDGSITITSVANISVTTATPARAVGSLAGSTMVQATATDMPWDSGSGLRLDGTADYLVSDAAAADCPFHKAAGYTWTCSVTFSADGVNQCVFATTACVASNVGIMIYRTAANVMGARVANGSGVTLPLYAQHSQAVTGKVICSGTWSEAGGARVLVNTYPAETWATAAAASAADADNTLHVGYRAAVGSPFYLDGTVHHVWVRQGAVSTAELSRLHDWMLANG